METIGKRLKKFREKAGLTQKQVSERIGVPVSTYRDWEYGKSIQGEPYGDLASLLEVTLVELITGQAPVRRDLFVAIDKLDEVVRVLKGIAYSSE